MPKNYKLKLSAVADNDLDSIYEYGFTQWGEVQADAYFDALLDHFQQLRCGSHSIFYRIADDDIEIMAVIGQQDIEERISAST